MKNEIMKKTMLTFSICIALFTSVLTSCKKDDDTNQNQTSDVNPNDFKGDISKAVTLDASKTYKLTGLLKIKSGGKLTIPAGTKIEGVGGTSSAIIIEQGGQIFINGTSTNPVVMTSGLATKARGDWGGLVICGKATCNSGGGMSEVGDVTYGGGIDNDNSGTIRYLRIEYSGAAFNSEKEYNGLSLFGVGNGTTIEYVQVFENADDGFEFYGGTVNVSNIISSHVEDDMFDWTEGWRGTATNLYGKNDLGFGNRGFEADNWETDNAATPISNPSITNVTLIGSGNQGNEPQGMELRRGTKANIDNVVLKNWNIGVRVSGDISQGFTTTNDLNVTNVNFIDCITDVNVGTIGNPSAITTNTNATGAGNGFSVPTWAQGWVTGLN
ncbi:MAG: hypothetical protein PHT69_03150 [Bacteroidales bacterium]|nr:hypothetical protein [Bacteroidales bacterium]